VSTLNELNKGALVAPFSNLELLRPPRCSGHARIESTVCYLGIEVDDAIEIAEKTDI
jgi:hypothetical protein